MNEAPDSERPADASDPLLEALRQRLGPSFGQEPPPAVWAGIRQQLPPAPRPWRLRSRRLLPLLLLLLLSVLTVGILTVRPPHGRTNRLTINSPDEAAPKRRVVPGRQLPDQGAAPVGEAVTSQPRALASAEAPAHTKPVAVAAKASAEQPTAGTGHSLPASPTNAAGRAAAPHPARPSATSRFSAIVANATLPEVERRQQLGSHQVRATAPRRTAASVISEPQSAAAALSSRQLLAPQRAARRAKIARHQATSLAGIALADTRRRARHRLAARPALGTAALASLPATSYKASITAASRSRSTVRLGVRAMRPQPESLPLAVTQEPLGHFAAPDTAGPAYEPLTTQLAAVLLPGPIPLPSLVADTVWHGLAPARRWSVLVLAGPTLSYRSAGALLINQPPYAYSNVPSGVATSPSYYYYNAKASPSSSLERPALGWGAQVQVRRVLSGRWSLALGLGYQEYATRLALQVRTYRAAATGFVPDTAIAVHQRDTYRLLTVPVQLGYALGPPRGRLSLGLLAGAEPGWYQGGRTTEGSGCNCQQQTFTQAEGSPYSAWTVALSLGLDLRYQLGGPASRWQLLVQPTGRYIATPFVRSNAELLYLRRQPYSLGLLTGVAWSWR